MKFVCKIDKEWHNSNEEMPRHTMDVDFMDTRGNIYPNGHIQIDMAGWYAYLKHNGYTSFDIMIKWKFKDDAKPEYYDYG